MIEAFYCESIQGMQDIKYNEAFRSKRSQPTCIVTTLITDFSPIDPCLFSMSRHPPLF
jgi:hypothetical protein